MSKIHIHQLFFDEHSRSVVDPAFVPLGHVVPPRPDWREFWPIVSYLRETTLVEDDVYGFLPPQFSALTGLSASDVTALATKHAASADLINLSPFPDQHALFWNVFEQGEYHIVGLSALCQSVLDALAMKVDVTELVMDSRTSVFGTCFIARPTFWRRWLTLAEGLIAMADDPANPLAGRLNGVIPSRADVPLAMRGQMKVAVLERMASLVLVLDPGIRAVAPDPFNRPRTDSVFSRFPVEAVLSDALKLAFNVRGDPVYKVVFGQIREQVQRQLAEKPAG